MSKIKTIKSWLNGDLELINDLEKAPSEEVVQANSAHNIHTLKGVEQAEEKASNIVYKLLCSLFCIIFIGALLFVVLRLPLYGSENSPTVNEVYTEYVENGTEKTGAVNTVAGMILDYRAFDTLGESFVLFCAVSAVFILMKNPSSLYKPKESFIDYSHDEIIKPVCKLIIPIILLFGIYVLLNGHLSPGGGFSGGAILGSGFILYTMVYGEKRASSVLNEKVIKTIVLCSLLFYCLSKTYSFFTGANHLHSIIGPGIAGRILSAGLILPLNVAVGLVVCCTMYSFYMLFRKGHI